MADPHDPLLDVLHEDRSHYRGAFAPPICRSSTFGDVDAAILCKAA